MIFVSKKAWEAHSKCYTPRFYLDLSRALKSLADETTPFTPNVSLTLGLSKSLELFEGEGLKSVYERHTRLRDALRSGLKALGLKLLVAEPAASPTITAILPPDGVAVADVRKGLKQQFRILLLTDKSRLKAKYFALVTWVTFLIAIF